jgi:hypothetical protein
MSVGAQVLRGSPERLTNHMESLQIGYLRAVAAAAGCVVAGSPEVDEGVDFILSHRSVKHSSGPTAYLAVQLKSTTQFALDSSSYISSNMRQDRYDEFRSPHKTMHQIAVVMSLPQQQSDWIAASGEFLTVRHCSYWVNLAGAPASNAARPSFRAPLSNIFDDVALCGIMERIGRGGKP